MSNPLVTVLMPVYNGEKYLREAIESILNQTYNNIEFLIINDGSTDKSLEIIKSYEDSRIRLINNEKNLNLTYTLNKGIKLANGKYIARMDCDDISVDKRIEREVEFLEANIEVGIVGTRFVVINRNGKKLKDINHPLTDETIKILLSIICPLAHGSVMVRRDIFEKNLYGSIEYSAIEDYELWIRISKLTKMHNISEKLFKYRIYGESYTNTKAKKMENQSNKIGKAYVKEEELLFLNLIKTQILELDFNENKEMYDIYINYRSKLIGRLLYIHKYEIAFKLYKKWNKVYGFNIKHLLKYIIDLFKSFIYL